MLKNWLTKLSQTIFHMAADTKGLSNNKFSLDKSTINNIKFIENLYSGSENKGVKIIVATTNAEYKNIEGKVNENSSCQPPFNSMD